MRWTTKTPRRCHALAVLCAILPMAAGAQTNPLARGAATPPATSVSALNGTWNGADIEQRSHCAATQNNGFHGTYAEYIYDVAAGGGSITLTENAVNGLHCTYFGGVTAGLWTGEVSCSDGKSGSFTSRAIVTTPNEISVRLAMKLTGSETCDIDAILGGSRF